LDPAADIQEMMKDRRLVLACIVSPLVFVLVENLYFLFFEQPLIGHYPISDIVSLMLNNILISVMPLAAAYIVEVSFGLAAWRLFLLYKIRSITAFALGGAAIAWIVVVGLGTLSPKSMVTLIETPEWRGAALLSVVSASVSAVVFRAILQPDRFLPAHPAADGPKP
jgi:hypothetical protein